MTPVRFFSFTVAKGKAAESIDVKPLRVPLAKKLAAISCALFFFAILAPLNRFALPSTVGAQSAHRKLAPPKVPPAAAKEIPQPFRVGETLNYRVSWAAFSNAASVQLSVPEKRDLSGWPAWHFRAAIHTVSPVRSLFAIDDEFDSYTDRVTLESRQYETYLNELGKKQEQVLHLLPSGQTLRGSGPVVIVLPGTRDPAGAFYSLRGNDWRRNSEIRAPIFDGHDVYGMVAKIESPAETVVVPAGSFSAARIAVQLAQNHKDVPIRFVIWLANNAARTPVQIQAELPFGSVRAGLTSVSP